jgi:hypothetical protein
MSEQVTIGVTPDVLALHDRVTTEPRTNNGGTLLVAEPKTQIVETLGSATPLKKNQVAVKHASRHQTVAVVEIVSTGNKASRHALRAFLDKTVDLLAKGIHLLVIDMHPSTKRDPNRIHAAIQEELAGNDLTLPAGKTLTLASYQAVAPPVAYVEPVAVGDTLPNMPLFLVPGGHVLVPLEKTYMSAWEEVPPRARKFLEPDAG